MSESTAIRFEVVGRGYGKMRVPVIDVAATGGGKSLHILADGKPLCGRKGTLGQKLEGVDARAIIVLRRPVCQSCRERLGAIPTVEFIRDLEGAA